MLGSGFGLVLARVRVRVSARVRVRVSARARVRVSARVRVRVSARVRVRLRLRLTLTLDWVRALYGVREKSQVAPEPLWGSDTASRPSCMAIGRARTWLGLGSGWG